MRPGVHFYLKFLHIFRSLWFLNNVKIYEMIK